MMTLRRLVVGMTVLFGLSFWSWYHADGNSAHAQTTADTTYAVSAAEESSGGNHDDATYRYRTSQPRHWRHVMIGGR